MSYISGWRTAFRDGAAVLVVCTVILSYTAIGFVGVMLEYAFGIKVTFPGDWMTGLYGLASGGLGYLIGKRDRAGQKDPVQNGDTP